MTPRSILFEARKRDLVPYHLYGETQHKTLQARLSEDILDRREHSAFFRTKPGHFFLREFLADATIPEAYRQPITARRRTRDLIRGAPLCINVGTTQLQMPLEGCMSDLSALCNLPDNLLQYVDADDALKLVEASWMPIWALAFMRRGNEVLSYRTGRYRDDRDAFAQKQTLTFSTLVIEADRSLFDEDAFGIVSSAFAAISIDLDIPGTYGGGTDTDFETTVRFVCWDHSVATKDFLVFIEITPPEWFEPMAKRLSLNDLHWITVTPPPNNCDDFDPWSRKLLDKLLQEADVCGKSIHAAPSESACNGNRAVQTFNRF